ncbi:mRNA decapping complex subunit 2 [Saitozyma sp. JCM 24511]|nr:mRNA decapping complex subunit 2 [Saitozyma sp. JCM 24511]
MAQPDEEDDAGEENIFRDMTFDEVMEDLNARFLVNLPKEEMTLVRIYWQAEQAHWFYEDYLRPLNPLLPSLSQRHFTQLIISSSPMYSSLAGDEGVDYDNVWAEYISYKSMVPCCGGILINQDGDKCLMVRGWKSNAGWSFPRGKINLAESEVDCAIREVEEETGFDLTGRINAVDNIQTQINAQVVTMFIVKDIHESTVFEAQTRKEIGAIEWVRLTELPTWTGKRPKKTSSKDKKFYNVTPFVGPLKRWLLDHGINPNAKPKKAPAQTQPQPYRDLQPYHFESPSPHPAQPHAPLARGGSALDNLFNKFVTKQEEALASTEADKATGSDNKAGLERLFGNLNVLQLEKREAEERTHLEQENEDDALAKLLGAVMAPPSAAQPTVPPPALAITSPKQSQLLAVLNQKQDPLVASASASGVPSTSAASAASVKPHQASLLAMLSPSKHAVPMPSVGGHGKPMSLPTSPRPPSANDDEERRNKQRALLEMTIAGIGLDSTSVTAPAPVPSSSAAAASLSFANSRDLTHARGPSATIDRDQHVISPQLAQGMPQSQVRPGYPQASPTKARPPPPPYEAQQRQIADYAPSLPPAAASYNYEQPSQPTQSQPQPHPHPVGSSQPESAQQPMSDHQRGLLGALHARPPMGTQMPAGVAQGYRPAQPGHYGSTIGAGHPSLPQTQPQQPQQQQPQPPSQMYSSGPQAFPGPGQTWSGPLPNQYAAQTNQYQPFPPQSIQGPGPYSNGNANTFRPLPAAPFQQGAYLPPPPSFGSRSQQPPFPPPQTTTHGHPQHYQHPQLPQHPQHPQHPQQPNHGMPFSVPVPAQIPGQMAVPGQMPSQQRTTPPKMVPNQGQSMGMGMHQPIPRPSAGAAGNLLAMINGTGGR